MIPSPPSAKTWELVGTLFDQLAALPPNDRDLDTLDQPRSVRTLLEQMLAAHDTADPQLLDQTVRAVAGSLLAPLEVAGEPADYRDRTFGPWRALEEIGRGGMAVVLRGERADERFEKEVAIKLLPQAGRGMERDRLLEEIRILARLEHPNIARLIDGGVEDGIPFLVMEYVRGAPITEYCDEHKLDIKARVQLLMQVVEAVLFAHRHLVVHCDIKPGNILVDDDGRARLVDFGIAGLVSGGRSEETAPRGLFCSPAYCAPEQMRGAPPETAQDVFSLGAVLYELLCGQRVRNNKTATRMLFGKAAGTTEVPPPSSHGPGIARDLDAICLKALANEPGERYAGANALLMDLKRWLQSVPVQARAHNPGYLVSKFVARNRLSVAASLGLLLAIGIGVVTTVWQAHKARIEAERAQTQERRAVAVRDLLAEIFRSTAPSVGDTPDALDLLEAASTRAREELVDSEPETAADILLLSGEARVALGDYNGGEADLKQALGLFEVQRPPPARSLSSAHWSLALIYKARGDYEPRLRHNREAVEWIGRWDAPEEQRFKAELSLAHTLLEIDDGAENEARLRTLLSDIEASGLENSHVYLDTLNSLTTFLAVNNRDMEERIQLHRQRIDVVRRLYGEDSGWYAYTLADSVPTLRKSPEHTAEAETIGREAVTLTDRIYQEPHLVSSVALCNLAAVLQAQQRYDEALELYDRVIAQDESMRRGDLHAESCVYGRAESRFHSGDAEGAMADLEADRKLLRQLDRERSMEWLRNCALSASIHFQRGRTSEARRMMLECENEHRPERGEPPERYLDLLTRTGKTTTSPSE